MEKKNLYIIGAGIGVIFFLLGIFTGYYHSKYKDTRAHLLSEMSTIQELEKQVDQLQSELSVTRDELSAKENMLEIYQVNLEALKKRMSANE